MALTHTLSKDARGLTVALTGDFTFAENSSFRRVVEDVMTAKPSAVFVDLSGLRLLDSAGLSMLVLLRDRIVKSGAHITLCRPPSQIERILEVVDFKKLFTILP